MKKLTLILIIISAIFISGCASSTSSITGAAVTGESITSQCKDLLEGEGYAFDIGAEGEGEAEIAGECKCFCDVGLPTVAIFCQGTACTLGNDAACANPCAQACAGKGAPTTTSGACDFICAQ